MKNKKLFLLSVISIFLLILLFNGLIFYFTKCNGEYLESRDLWGNTQSIQKVRLNKQMNLLRNLSEDKEEALLQLNEVYMQKLNQYNARSKKGQEMDSVTRANLEEELADLGAVSKKLEKSIQYEKTIHHLEDNAQKLSQVSIFQQEGFEKNISITMRDFYGLSSFHFSILYDNGLNVFLNYRITDFLAAFLAVGFAILFAIYQKWNLQKHMQKKGHFFLRGALFLVLACVLLYGTNWILMNRELQAYQLSDWVQSFEAFYAYPKPIQLLSFLGYFLLAKSTFFLVLYGLCLLITLSAPKFRPIVATLTGVGILAESYWCFGQKGTSLGNVLQEINLFSAVTMERFFTRYYHLNVFGLVFSRTTAFVIFWSVFCMALLVGVSLLVRKNEREVLQKVQFSYYEEMEQKYTETRQLWHDFHNHLLAIQELTRTGDIDAANRYMKELESAIDETHILTKTGSQALDVLIYRKNQMAKEAGIHLDISILAKIKREEFADVDMCCVVGNLLDNCLEALKDYPSEQKKATLEIQRKGDMLFITSRNAYVGERKQSAHGFRTTKQDAKNHGYGLSGIKRVCEKYHGSLQVETKEGEFLVKVLMMAQK